MNQSFLTFSILSLVFILLNILSLTNTFKKYLLSKHFCLFSLIFVLLVQIVSIFLIKYEVGDIQLNNKAGQYLRLKLDFYEFDSTHSQYPFFPFLIYFHALGNLLHESFNLSFSFFLKLFLLIPSLWGLGFLIKRFSLSSSEIEKRLSQIQFLISPITFFIVLFHGQVDVVLLLFFFISVIFLFSKNNITNSFMAGIFYGFSILSKTWAIIFTPIVLWFQKDIKKIISFLLAVLFTLTADVFIYTQSVYYTKLENILPALFRPGGPIGTWGIPLFLSPFPKIVYLISQYNLYYFVVLLTLIYFLVWKTNKSFLESCFWFILGVYLIIPNWGVQYLFWILPFVFIIKEKLNQKNLIFFTILSSVYLFLNYTNVIFEKNFIPSTITTSFAIILWFYFLYWFTNFLRRSKS